MAEGRSLQESINFVADFVKERYHAYAVEKEKIPSWGSKVDQDAATYVTSMEQWVIGFLRWSFSTERYFGTNGEDIMKTGVVTLLSKKTK